MDKFTGCILKESLEDKSILDDIRIVSIRVEPTTEKHKTPWVKQWTHLKVEIDIDEAEGFAEKISKALDSNPKHVWYADFKNKNTHYVIFKNKVFCINRDKEEEYNEATRYGISLGIPEYQVDFSKNVKKWER